MYFAWVRGLPVFVVLLVVYPYIRARKYTNDEYDNRGPEASRLQARGGTSVSSASLE
jgi:hypothetical protein